MGKLEALREMRERGSFKQRPLDSPAQRIIEGLKDAIAGNYARITIDGHVWVREDLLDKPKPKHKKTDVGKPFDKKAYQRELMRKRRAKGKA